MHNTTRSLFQVCFHLLKRLAAEAATFLRGLFIERALLAGSSQLSDFFPADPFETFAFPTTMCFVADCRFLNIA